MRLLPCAAAYGLLIACCCCTKTYASRSALRAQQPGLACVTAQLPANCSYARPRPKLRLLVTVESQTGHVPAAATSLAAHAVHAGPCPHGCSSWHLAASAAIEHTLHSLLLEVLPEAEGTLADAAEPGLLGVLGASLARAWDRATCCSIDLHSSQPAAAVCHGQGDGYTGQRHGDCRPQASKQRTPT